MKDLLQEIKELQAVAERVARVANSYGDTEPECDSAVEHRQHADWLIELLEIKKARLSVEVFFEQEYNLEPDPDEEDELGPVKCFRCDYDKGLEERDGNLVCPSCGAVNREGNHDQGD